MFVDVVFTVHGLIPVMRETVEVERIDLDLVKEVLNARLSELGFTDGAGGVRKVASITSMTER